MYLRELFIKNSGPVKELHLDFTFSENDNPIPHVIVGRNGSGKTNLLSIIAEALMYGAGASAFNDVLTQKGLSRSFFRVLGGKTISYGEMGGFAILRFKDGDDEFFYRENAGDFSTERALGLIPSTLADGAKWNSQKQGKAFGIPDDRVRKIYPSGVYVYFPSSRSEHPFWFNPAFASESEDEYDLTDSYTSSLGKPMFVEHGIDAFAQWLLGVITEARMPVLAAQYLDDQQRNLIDQNQVVVRLDTSSYMRTQQPLVMANDILKAILDDPDARFEWIGRRISKKVGVLSGDRAIALGLDSLSGGQATLLAIFGTILRYADVGRSTAADLTADDIRGVVIIDELDAHMHIDLQTNALPKLIAMFPQIQFIVSSHSPIFALGMEKHFPNNGVRIIDLPTGLAVNAEAYDEFASALTVLMKTHAFEERVGEFLAAAEQPIVFVEGETDVMYFRKAATLLGYPQLEDYFQWIGTPGQSGGGNHTGVPALKSTVQFLKANSDFTHRQVIVIYDNDANQEDETFGNLHVIGLAKIEDAALEDGIENLLPAHVFTEDVFQNKQVSSGIARRPKIIPELKKRLLCERLCGASADPATFQNFAPILNRINSIIIAGAGNQVDEAPGVNSVEGSEEPPSDRA